MKSYLLALDEGTTGTKALVMDTDLNVISEALVNFPQHFPCPGWVEHDLNEIWKAVLASIKKATSKINTKNIVGIGITNQRETICFWDKTTGEPLTRAIVWQDRRTSEECEILRSKGAEPFFQERTGLLLDPYFSGTKVAWAFKHWPEIKEAYDEKRLAVGTIDSFLLARLAGGGVHATEPSNASRTLCFRLTELKWDHELCQGLGVPPDVWPEVRPSFSKFAATRGVDGLPDGIPITGILGDQQAALLGQTGVEVGNAKCTYGTGAFMLLNTGSRPSKSRHKLLSTVAWQLASGQTTYALEGSAFVAGAAVQWIRDGLKLIKNSAEIEALAASVPSSEGVVFVPALTGLGAPYWDPYARGLVSGLTRGTTSAHLARAVLEGVAFQNADLLQAMQKDFGQALQTLNVDGGACANDLLMQFQSDILGVPLLRPLIRETTSLGAIIAAGMGLGIWKDFDAIKKSWQLEKRFEPVMASNDREAALQRWRIAVKQAQVHSA